MYLKKRCHESQKLCAFASWRGISSLVNASNKTETALIKADQGIKKRRSPKRTPLKSWR
jgi:hypothetical protein